MSTPVRLTLACSLLIITGCPGGPLGLPKCGDPEPVRVVFVDDEPRNLDPDGNTTVEFTDGRRARRPGIFGNVGDEFKAQRCIHEGQVYWK